MAETAITGHDIVRPLRRKCDEDHSVLEPAATLFASKPLQFPTELLISPPFWCPVTNRYALRIKHRSEEYILKWRNSPQRQNLSQFPQLKADVMSERVEHSKEEAKIWASSHLRAFGSYAHVRKSEASEGSFPMYKIAHRASKGSTIKSEISN